MFGPLSIDQIVNNDMLSVIGNPVLNWFFWIISISVVLVIAFSAFYFWFVRKDKLMTGRIVIGSIAVYLITELIKRVFLRVRPNGIDSFSFPSRHTAIAFAIAVLLPVKRKYKVLLYVWAILVAFSRLWLQEHWLSDVLVGAGIGLIAGWALSNYKNKIKI